MKLRLQITTPSNHSSAFDFDGEYLRIGRDPECELKFQGDDNQQVSWKHARIQVTHQGLVVTDLESSNGTFVNGKQINSSKRLNIGDLIQLGTTGPQLKVAALEATGAYSAPPSDPVRTPTRKEEAAAGLGAPQVQATKQTIATRVLVNLMESRHRKFRIWLTIGIGLAIAVILSFLFFQWDIIVQILGRTTVLEEQVADARAAASKAQDDALKAYAESIKIKEFIPPTGNEIYNKVVRTNVFILNTDFSGKVWRGSGSVIDRKNRLVLTAYHVVEGTRTLTATFPDFDTKGNAIPTQRHYLTSRISAKVVAESRIHDLAVIRVDRIPAGITELPLARKSPLPGERVHTVGNPGACSSLWVYTSGSVRQVIHKTALRYTCWMIEFQNPINGGDSGGPVVNDRGELVGVNSTGYTTSEIDLVNSAIDIREIRSCFGKFSTKFR